MNNCRLEIYENKTWVDYTKYMVASFKFANLLDEQLDEGSISLARVPNVAYFKPMTRIRVVITNSPKAKYSQEMAEKIRLESDLKFKLVDGEYKSYDNRTTFYYDENTRRITQTSIKEFLLANDTSIENPVGSGKYDHEIYLIEQTKYLERFIGDSITFTNALGTNIDNNGYIKSPYIHVQKKDTSSPILIKDFIKLVFPIGSEITFPTYNIISDEEKEYIKWEEFDNAKNLSTTYRLSLEIRNNGEIVASQYIWKVYDNGEYKYFNSFDPQNNEETDSDLVFTVNESATYEVVYKFQRLVDMSPLDVAYIEYFFGVANNVLPLKKWTITDVCNRIFDTIEPLVKDTDFKNVKPRFRLQGVKYDEQGEIVAYSDNSFYEPNSLADKYDKILSPEFSFSQNTLREMLSQIGGFIHAEPRIIQKVENDNDEYWEIGFDEYGSIEYSNISKKPYISAGYKTNVNDYCTSLDSSAQNLINMIDYAQGVTFEPFYCGETSGKGIGLRTENTAMRISEDDSSFIPTTFKNYMFKGNNQVRITYIPDIGNGSWDITPYIFEKDDYFGSLDSFEGAYPNSKQYALYYTQGTQNIYGLFFKATSRKDSSRINYSIINIIELAIGRKLGWDKYEGETLEKLREVRFSISYLPISNARIKTSKQNVLGGLPSTIAYNQNANLVETNYYGENLKGITSRLGNVEKTYTYHLAFLSDLPKVGTKFDKDYYISSVSTEILPLYVRCTIGLSKDFNRLSEYVGISSEKRMWEVSKNASERQSVYTEYLVLSKRQFDKTYIPAKSEHWNRPFGEYMRNANNDSRKPINIVEITTKDKKGNTIETLCFPVISMAVGNSLVFTFAFQDNYSAGQRIESGGWSNYVSYADIYGRFYYLDMRYFCGEPSFKNDDNEHVAKNFPLADLDYANTNSNFRSISIENYRYRKDNRETPQITYELCAVSEDESLIIGSAFMKNCILVNRKAIPTFKVYGFNNDLNKFENEVDITKATYIGDVDNKNYGFLLPENKTGQTFKSWAIITPETTITEKVEDEDGNDFEQVLSRGCELILGANAEYKDGEIVLFEIKGIRDIYDV